ncbi:MAG: hydantoinase/oxoprolinase family protein [Rhizobiaceae bacterium]|nr:hydantoinase/oxoprolinase family protein [Rhizobiaceae bacterium]
MAAEAAKALGGTSRLGVDIGGTFTDAALLVGSKVFSTKVLTTHDAPERGVLQSIDKVLADASMKLSEVDIFIHGTTLATNALIERKGAKIAMLTTEGARDVVEVALSYRFDLFDLTIDLPTPLVERSLRLPIRERIGYRGRTLVPLNEEDILRCVERIREENIESLAICFLHSFENDAHEKRAREIIRQHLPDLPVSISSEVAGEIREYERFTTTTANAYVQPLMAAYLDRLEQRLQESGLKAPFLLMLSDGGLTDVGTAKKYPIRLVESGPAGGAMFAAAIARQEKLGDVVSFDMGGTTAKICMINSGEPETARDFEVARVYRFKKGSGLPLRVPVINMVEIGAGGGSIAHRDSLGRISVGPESAGSQPGPAAYGRGGTKPTVSDADLVLGRINPAGFAGGRMALDLDAARKAISLVGDTGGLSADEAAAGIIEVVEENMASAARVHAIECGKSIISRTLVAFGGAAPLHAAGVARKIGMGSFVVPPSAGVGSAVGFFFSPIAFELATSRHKLLAEISTEDLNDLLASMESQVLPLVEKVARSAKLYRRYRCSMRYVGQGHEIEVEIPLPLPKSDISGHLKELFEEKYQLVYGRKLPGAEVEALSWALWIGTASPALDAVDAPDTTYEPSPKSTRRIYDTYSYDWIECAVYWREDLRPGAVLAGPAVIEESETTTFVPGGMSARILGTGAIFCTELTESRAAEEAREVIHA